MKKTQVKILIILTLIPSLSLSIVDQVLLRCGIKIGLLEYFLVFFLLFSLTFCAVYYAYGPIINTKDLKFCIVDSNYPSRVFEYNKKRYSFMGFLGFRIAKLKTINTQILNYRYKLCIKNPPIDAPSEVDFLALIIVLRTRPNIDISFMKQEHLQMDLSEYNQAVN